MKIRHAVVAFRAVNVAFGLAVAGYAAAAFAGDRPDLLADVRPDSLAKPRVVDAYTRNIDAMRRLAVVEVRAPSARPPSVNLALFITVRGFLDSEASVQAAGNDQTQFWMACGDEVYGRLVGRDIPGDIALTRGWRVKELRPSQKQVVFSNGREEQTLAVGSAAERLGVPPELAALVGTPYDASRFSTKLTMNNPTQKLYAVDPDEVLWGVANQRAILDGAGFAPAEGGLRVTRVTPGSILEARGFEADDVIQLVNGTPVDSIESLRKIGETHPRTIQVQINRAGQVIRLFYTIPPAH